MLCSIFIFSSQKKSKKQKMGSLIELLSVQENNIFKEECVLLFT